MFCGERDRVRALQLLLGVRLQLETLSNMERAEYFLTLAGVLGYNRGNGYSWRLRNLTEIERFPEFGTERPVYGTPPVNPDGSPVLYQVPASFEAAVNDGERWRWALAQAQKAGDVYNAEMNLADFLAGQFCENIYRFQSSGGERELGDHEFFAMLANGFRRFSLPDDQNPILIYKSLLQFNRPEPFARLSGIYRTRDRLRDAVGILKEWLDKNGDAADRSLTAEYQELTGCTGFFEEIHAFGAGRKPVVVFNYTNTPEVDLILRPFDMERFLEVIRKELTEQKYLDTFHDFMSFRQILTTEQKEQFLGAAIDQWMVKLDPGTEFRQQRIEMILPVTKPGVYLLTALVSGKEELREIICISEYSLEVRALKDSVICYVTDAISGEPVKGRKVKFWGCRTDRSRKPVTRLIEEFEVSTDARGLAVVSQEKFKEHFSYVIEVMDGSGKSSYAFALHYSYSPYRMERGGHGLKVFGISNQPVYRPGDTVNFQFWLRDLNQQADKPKIYSEQEAEVTVNTARGSEIWKKTLKTDAAGMLWGNFTLPDEVELGSAVIRIVFKGTGLPENLSRGLTFRVEEYRKPEFEVEVRPSRETVIRGEKFDAVVKAEYYFGGPVRGKVGYRVSRQPVLRPLAKLQNYSWLYENTISPWLYPEELVMSGVGELGEDGTFKLSIVDEAGVESAAERDYFYRISAEVSDATRRTVKGSGSVLAAAAPYRAELEMNKGFYRVGEDAVADIRLFDAARRPASGLAGIALFAIAYDADRKAVETRLRDWTGLKIGEKGLLKHSFRFNNPGVYRLRVSVRAGEREQDVEVIRDVVVLGGEREKIDYEFGNLKIFADRELYAPGDTAELLITSGVKDGVVLWFERVDEGKQPEIVRLESGMAVRKIKLREQDMPNMFVEAGMVRNGERFSDVIELKIPPDRKILNVDISPSQPHFAPGTEGALNLKITDASGKGVKGIFTLAVYDKALEYISGGSNVPDVRKFFWGELRPRPYFGGYFNMGRAMTAMTGGSKGMARFKMQKAAPMAANMAADGVAAAGGGDVSGDTVMRSDFRDSAVWRCAVLTNENGESTIPVPLPDDITAWKGWVWAIDDANAVGQGETEFVAKKDLFIRLIMPRFLVSGDRARFMGVIHNSTGNRDVQAVLNTEDGILSILGKPKSLPSEPDETRNAWTVKAVKPGTAQVTARATAGNSSDALQQKLPVLDYGLRQLWSIAGFMDRKSSDSIFVPLEFPRRIAPGSAMVEVKLATSPASNVVELLPALIVNDRRDLYALTGRLHALIAARRFVQFNIETGLIHKIPPEYSMVYNEAEFNKIAFDTLKTLADYQNPDGGWGWFSGYYEVSAPDTTAYAVAALSAAAGSGFKIDEKALAGGVAWLLAYTARDREKMDLNTAAMVNYALSAAGKQDSGFKDFIYERRKQLTLYHLALLGLSCGGEQRQMVLRNLSQFLVENPANFTIRLKSAENTLIRSGVYTELEANAAYLRLLLQAEPGSALLPKLAKYLAENRRYSLQDTAFRQNAACVEALHQYLSSLAPGKVTAGIEVRLDGRLIERVALDGNIMLPPRSVRIGPDVLKERRHSLEFKRSGEGPLYFTVNQECYNQEETFEEAGSDLRVRRFYWRLQPLGDDQYRRSALKSGDLLEAGDLVEAELMLDTACDFRYLMIDDRRPAGLEPVDPISGYSSGYFGTYIETRNTATRFYIKSSGIGSFTWSYRLKAETDGVFTALPATAVTLYVPGIQGNSTEFKFKIGSNP